jgi:signal transduction histidine kinase/CheY-like chemotaxis protein/HPt (histidine-containing phosphotransfer) domain-containing protein
LPVARPETTTNARMTLQKKVVLVFLLLGAVFAMGSRAGLKYVVSPSFENFERETAKQNMARAQQAITVELAALDIISREYSEWDHAYDYVRGLRDEFVAENLDISYWQNIDINMMLYFDLDGQMLWGTIVDQTMTEEVPLEDELIQPLTTDHPLLKPRQNHDRIHGLLQARSAPMLVSANPVLTSMAEGPVAGTLVIGKYIDAARVESLGDRAFVDLSIYDRNVPGDAERFSEVELSSLDSDGGVRWEYGDEDVVGLEVLQDVFGSPAFLLEVRSSRRITDIGQGTIQTASIFLLVVSIIFVVSAWMLMRHLIVTPIGRLTRHILKIRQTGDLSQKFESKRKDEIGLLAQEFSQLTDNLSTVQIQLEASRDKALAMSFAKSEFLARMSHEIRTPMNGVLGMIELLNGTPLAKTQKRYAQTIHESADTLLDIINDVLDFSKIEAGRLRLEEITFDLNAFLSDMTDSLTGLAHQKGLTLECITPNGEALAVHGDPFRLRQVLTNLIGNAIKFTDEGGVQLRVAARKESGDQVKFHFEVIDTGIGIAKKKQEIIFDSFSQEDGSTTRRYGGTGLGLTISRELVEMMGGELALESEPGKGSTFSFEVSMKASSETDFSESARSLQKNIFTPKSRPVMIGLLHGRVLVAEDNVVNQEVATGMLSAMGVEVVMAKNGVEVMEHFSPNSFDAVLMDCQMPVMDGFQAAREIRRIEAGSNHKPVHIIAVTANALAGDRDKCAAAGMNDYLSKPFTGEQLYNMLSKCLGSGDPASRRRSNIRLRKEAAKPGNVDAPIAIVQSVLDDLESLPQSGSRNLVRRVIGAYLGGSTEILTRIGAAIELDDAAVVRASAHSLKSSSANVGAMALADLCKLMEAAGQQNDLSRIRELWQALQDEHDKVVVELRSLMGVVAA